MHLYQQTMHISYVDPKMVISVVVHVVLAVLVIVLVKYIWSRRKLYAFAARLSGPIALPIIGNGLLFRCQPDEIYHVLVEQFTKYKHPMRLWMGPQLFVIFSDLQHVEKIMSSPKMATKAEFYKFMGEYGPSGLIHSSGPRWKEHRRMMQPLLNLKYAYMNIVIIQKHIDKLLQRMDEFVDAGLFDVQQLLHPCCFDIIGDIILGSNPDTQGGNCAMLVKYFKDYYLNAYTQMVKPWLHFRPIFNLTKTKKDRDEMIRHIREFATETVEKSKERTFDKQQSPRPVVDQMLEILKEKPNLMNADEFIDNLLTLYSASEDTSTIITAATCLCLGMYPEYQERAISEIRDTLGNRKRVMVDDLSRLKYLEMCIKDAMRLFPIGPFLVRQTVDEFAVGEYVIPTGCQVLIPVHDIHRDGRYWENPGHFHPDHFLPDAIEKRNSYAYMPFSTGPRSCIGLHVAMQTLKILMANLLQRYRFEADGQIPDVNFTSDISLRVKGGYNVKITRRL